MNQRDAAKNMSCTHLMASYLRSIHHNISLIRLFFRRYKNPVRVLYDVYTRNYPVHVILKNGMAYEFSDFYSMYNNLIDLHYDSTNGVVQINGFQFYGGRENGDNLASIFIKKEYDFLQVKGKQVIDIGANIADSAIYFVQAGAVRVVGLEPNKLNYDLAKLNIFANHLSDRIEIIHAYASSRPVPVMVSIDGPKMISLEHVIDQHRVKPEILKVDCEGCEYDLICDAPDKLLSQFKYIQIEYHYGYKNLMRKLKGAGFIIDFTPPRFFAPLNSPERNVHYDNNLRYNSNTFVGWIRAYRN